MDMGHLEDVGKGWFSHLKGAWGMAFVFLFGGMRLLVHGLLPFVDTEAGQRTVSTARRRMGHEE